MNKLSRPNYGLEQEIMETIFRLRDKKSSELFKQPVDKNVVPDYYQKIKNPMDLSTIIIKLKSGKYQYAKQVYEDLELIIQNCKVYNIQYITLLKKAEQFQECIKTEWNNFQKQLKKKQISILKQIQINQDIQKRLLSIEEKRKKKKVPILQTTLQAEKKNILPQYSILPSLPSYLFQDKNQVKQDLPEELAYKKQCYSNLTQQNKTQKLNMTLDHSLINEQFIKICQKKLQKYKKILYKKIMWIQEKIIQKCLQKKKFRKMLLPEYLSKFVENGEIANELNIRKIQMYVKQVTYWVEEYSQILSHYMKEKFVDTCKTIRKCLLRVLRYKRIPKVPKTTKITLELSELQGEQQTVNVAADSNTEIDRQLSMVSGLGDEQSKRYESRMKEFRRMLYKDRSQSTKRDTKITIKNQNGEFSIVDWNSQVNEKRKVSRGPFGQGIKSLESRQFDEEKRKKQQRRDELKKDEDFIAERRVMLNRQILEEKDFTYEILWDVIQNKKFFENNPDVKDSLEGFCLRPKIQEQIDIKKTLRV